MGTRVILTASFSKVAPNLTESCALDISDLVAFVATITASFAVIVGAVHDEKPTVRKSTDRGYQCHQLSASKILVSPTMTG